MYEQSILSASSELLRVSNNAQENTRYTCTRIVNELLSQTTDSALELIILHFSSEFIVADVSEYFVSAFPTTQIIGCTSAGEFDGNGYQTTSLVAIAFEQSAFACSTILLSDLSTLDFDTAYNTARQLRQDLLRKDHFEQEQLMFLSFIDGLNMIEENFLHTFAAVFGNVPHFGGSAGDDLKLKATFVVHNKQTLQNAAVIALIGSRRPFKIFSNDHIKTPVSQLVVTQANPETRTVYELNGEPAAEYYAKLLGIKGGQLTPKIFSVFPLAVLVDKRYFIRSIQKVNLDDSSITFYCAVDLGMILTFVQMGDCIESLNNKLIELEDDCGQADFVYGCDCFLRRLEIQQRERKEDIAKIHKKYNIVGFNAYGEHINSIHLNQTFTGIYFGTSNA
ncbi:MAG: FIST N-terminal domain-containing protein [Pseudomonadota bacterium]